MPTASRLKNELLFILMIHFPRDILCIFWWWTIIAWNKRNSRKAYPLQRSPKIDFRVATIGKIDASLQSWNVIRWVAFCIDDKFEIWSHYAIRRLSHWKVNVNNFRWHYHPDVEFASAIERFFDVYFFLTAYLYPTDFRNEQWYCDYDHIHKNWRKDFI